MPEGTGVETAEARASMQAEPWLAVAPGMVAPAPPLKGPPVGGAPSRPGSRLSRSATPEPGVAGDVEGSSLFANAVPNRVADMQEKERPSVDELREGAAQAAAASSELRKLSEDLAKAAVENEAAANRNAPPDEKAPPPRRVPPEANSFTARREMISAGLTSGASFVAERDEVPKPSSVAAALAAVDSKAQQDGEDSNVGDAQSNYLAKRLRILGFDVPENLVSLASYLDDVDEKHAALAERQSGSRPTTPNAADRARRGSNAGIADATAAARRGRRFSIQNMAANTLEAQVEAQANGLPEEQREDVVHNLGRLHRTSSLAYGLSADGDAASKASAAALTAVSGTSGTDHEHDEHDDLNVDVDDVDEDAIVKKQKIKHRLIISPTSTFRRSWDLFILLLILYNALLMPYRLAFALANPGPVDMFDTVADVIFLMDLAFNTRTAFVDSNNKLISDPKKIFIHYACSWLIIDALSSVPFNLIALMSGAENGSLENMKMTKSMRLLRLGKMVRLLRLLRLMKLVKLMGTTEKQMNTMFRVHPGVVKIMKMFTGMLVIFHWSACICGAVAGEETSLPWNDQWTGVDRYNDRVDGSKYLFMLYFTITSMLGERVDPQSDLQALTSLLICVLGSMIYLGLVGSILNILGQIDEGKAAFKNELDKLSHYMVQRDFPKSLQRRIKTTKVHQYQSARGFDDQKILEDLPLHLRQDVAMFLHRDMIMNLQMFKACSLAFVQDLVMRLKPLPVQPGDFVIRAGTCGTEMFFLISGECEVLDVEHNVVAKCHPYCFFGEVSLIYNIKRNCSIRASEVSDLMYLEKSALMDLRKFHQHEVSVIAAFAKQRFEKRKIDSSKNKAYSGALELLYHGDDQMYRGLEVLVPALKQQRVQKNVKNFANIWKSRGIGKKSGMKSGMDAKVAPEPPALEKDDSARESGEKEKTGADAIGTLALPPASGAVAEDAPGR